MRKFHCLLFVLMRSYIYYYIICMIVPLIYIASVFAVYYLLKTFWQQFPLKIPKIEHEERIYCLIVSTRIEYTKIIKKTKSINLSRPISNTCGETFFWLNDRKLFKIVQRREIHLMFQTSYCILFPNIKILLCQCFR